MKSEDEQHLDLLAIFHFVWAAPLFLLSLLPIVHIGIGLMVMFEEVGEGHPGPPPFLFGLIFVIMGSVFVGLGMTCVVLNVISGLSLRKRTRKTLSLVTAGINCIFLPVGTVLGVFTIIVLLRESVVRLYATGTSAPPLPPQTGAPHGNS